jgi:predicted ribonuclease YlaK
MAKQQKSKVLDLTNHRATMNARTVNQAQVSNRLKVRIDDLKTFDPLTPNQGVFFEEYNDNRNIAHILHGCPGTGKTWIALYKALEQVLDKSNPYYKIIIVRSSVQTRDQGFMPGDVDEKMAMFESPYISMTQKMFDNCANGQTYQRLKEQGIIEFCSTSFLRGETFDNCVVIFDEAQSATEHEIETVLTRVGDFCKIILCCDTNQNDLVKEKSGLTSVMRVMKNMDEVHSVEFTIDDIVRSGFVKSYLLAKLKIKS